MLTDVADGLDAPSRHMDRYLAELEWRSTTGTTTYIFRNALRRLMNTDPLQYQKLVS